MKIGASEGYRTRVKGESSTEPTPLRGVLSTAPFEPSQLGFSLSSAGERILLVNSNQTRVLDALGFDAQARSVSSGRFPDGAPGLRELAANSPGTEIESSCTSLPPTTFGPGRFVYEKEGRAAPSSSVTSTKTRTPELCTTATSRSGSDSSSTSTVGTSR